MKHDGWTNRETKAMAQWLCRTPLVPMLEEISLGFDPLDLSSDDLIASLTEAIEEQLRLGSAAMLADLAAKIPPSTRLGFAAPLLTVAMEEINFQEIAAHWAQVLVACPPPNI